MTRTTRRLIMPALATLAAVLGLVATGSIALASGTQVLHLSAAANMVLRFSTSHLHAHPGRIELVMHNPSNSGLDHGIAIQGHGVHRSGPIVGPGSNSTVTVTLGRGSYAFYCPVPGHRQAGMRGTLTVS